MCLKGRASSSNWPLQIGDDAAQSHRHGWCLKGQLEVPFHHQGSWFCITQVKTNRVPARPPELKLGRANQEVNDAMSPSYRCRQCRAVEVRRTEATGGRCVALLLIIKALMSFLL